MADIGWSSALRTRRERAGVSQGALAAEVGVTRQALTAIEAGRQVPSTALALALARALGCRVEDLFALGAPGALEVELASSEATSRRLLVGRVGGRWIAHRVRSPGPVDAVLDHGGRAEPLASDERLARNLLVAGCAPLLGALAGRLGARAGAAEGRWIWANSERALELLARQQVHVAGVHLAGDASRQAALVRARLPGRPLTIVHLARWRQGLLLPPGNPRGLRSLDDALASGARFARREAGSAAAKLLDGYAAPPGPIAHTHEEVAQLVRGGAADAGVAIEGVARSFGLDFVPLSEERFDLVLDAAAAEPAARLLEALAERAFRVEASAMEGYDLGLTGARDAVDA